MHAFFLTAALACCTGPPYQPRVRLGQPHGDGRLYRKSDLFERAAAPPAHTVGEPDSHLPLEDAPPALNAAAGGHRRGVEEEELAGGNLGEGSEAVATEVCDGHPCYGHPQDCWCVDCEKMKDDRDVRHFLRYGSPVQDFFPNDGWD
jgi:hypothetical protein